MDTRFGTKGVWTGNKEFDGMKENWKDIVGYEGFYKVSNFGRVKSLNRLVPSKKTNGWMAIQEKILKQTNSNGYRAVTLTMLCVCHSHRVHRLVWTAFSGPIPNWLEINHKNGNKSDNRLNNLELLTHQLNMLHASNKLDRFKNRKGEGNPRAKISEELAKEIKKHGESFSGKKRPRGTISNAAKLFGVSRYIISGIWDQGVWGHLC